MVQCYLEIGGYVGVTGMFGFQICKIRKSKTASTFILPLQFTNLHFVNVTLFPLTKRHFYLYSDLLANRCNLTFSSMKVRRTMYQS